MAILKYRIVRIFPITGTACVAILLQLIGCIGAGNVQAAQDFPNFVETQCDFQLDSPRRAVCGVLTVFENRSSGSNRRIRIPVVTFLSSDTERHADPVVYVPDGRGIPSIYSPLRLLATWPRRLKDADWLAGRDLIIFDPRGTGMAEPSLDCPEEKTTSEKYPITAVPIPVYKACLEKLRKSGIDLGAYNAIDLATDLNELRQAMGVESWNIWAESYGTRVALEAIRREESGIRSVILEAPYPPGMDDPLVIARNFDRILTELIASCPQHRHCRPFAPDLSVMFQKLLKDLRKNPRELKILSRHSLQVRSYEVDDSTFLYLLFHAVHRRQGLSSLPFIIIIAHQGRLDFSPIHLSDLVGYSRYVSLGAQIQIFCSDGASANPNRVQEAMELVPYLAGWIETSWTNDDCQELIGHQKPALNPSVVESNLPVLLLSGAFDPVTPTERAHEAVKHLRNGHLFVFPGESHKVSGNLCAQLIMKRFLDDPDKKPSDPCFLLESRPRPGP